jgi:iron complex transport system substrate-binding protein
VTKSFSERSGESVPASPSAGSRLRSRREFIGAGGAMALALGLAACGGSAATAGSGTGSRSRLVPSARGGHVRVPANPRRIVSIQPSITDSLYDFGLLPIGVYNLGAEYVSPRYIKRWNRATKIGVNGVISVEKIATLNPDLIIGSDYSWNTKYYGQLKQIAPTVITPVTNWQAISESTAEAVNRMSDLRALQKQLLKRSAEIKATYAAVLAKYRWDILQGGFDSGEFWLYGPGSDTGQIIGRAGVQFASASAAVKGESVKQLSYEHISILSDADVIGFYSGYNGKPTNDGPALFAQPQFKQLDAVKAGRTVPFPDFLPGGYGDALAVLDELESGLKQLGTR